MRSDPEFSPILTCSRFKRISKLLLFTFTAPILFLSQQVCANPINPTVANGQASFNTQGNTLAVTNTPGAIINWQGFSIGSNEATRFIQQNASSAVLNRVTGNTPSSILGVLQSNGQVYLVNPNGIVFGAGSTIDVNGLVASTLNLSDADFLAGRHNYTAVPGAQNISNAGNITAQSGGQIYLIAPNVENSGIIAAPSGEILLAAGNSVQLVNSNDPNLRVSITSPTGNATNLGKLIADSGSLGLFGTVVRNAGQVSADSAALQGGKIVFKSSGTTLLDAGSVTSATGTSGGRIQVQGNTVALNGDASVDASGTHGGGTVLIGGDAHGANPNVQNAQYTYVNSNVTIKADATQNGNGGKVVVWSDNATQFNGNISAQGGVLSGNGGWVEVSGKQRLSYNGLTNTLAAHGQTGSLLLDPSDITITNTGTNNVTCIGTGVATCTGPGAASILLDTTLVTQLGLTNVTVDTTTGTGGTGNITVASAIGWATANSLTLNATGTGAITVNAGVTNIAGGSLVLTTTNGSITLNGAVVLDGGGQLPGSFSATANGASSDVLINALVTMSPVTTVSGAINITAGRSIIEGTGGMLNSPLGTLTTTSVNGTTLNNANVVANFSAINTTSGNIAFTNNNINGPFSIVAGGLNGSIPGVINQAPGGSISLTNSAPNMLFSNGGAQIVSNNGAITLTADQMNLTGIGTPINSGTGNVTLQNFTNANAISLLGGVTAKPVVTNTLVLSQTDLNAITTSGLLNIGNATNSGTITVSAPTTLAYNTTLVNGVGGITDNGGITATNANGGAFNLTLDTAGLLTLNSAINAGTIYGLGGKGVTLGTAAALTSSSVQSPATPAGIVLNAGTGNFVNSGRAPTTVLTATGSRWLVYSTDPATDNFGGLVSGNLAQWGATYASIAPAKVTGTGNFYLFSITPTLTAAVNGGNITKTYGTTTVAPTTTITGLVNAATYNNVFNQDASWTGTAAATSAGFAANAHVNGGTPYIVTVAGNLVAPAGYAIAYNDVTLTVTPAPLTAALSNTGVIKVYDGTTAAPPGFAPTYNITGFVAGDTAAGLTDLGAAYNSAHVSSANALTVSGLAIGGITGANGSLPGDYVLNGGATSLSVAATVTPASLTAALSNTGVIKVYDGTTAAPPGFAPTYNITGFVAGDTAAGLTDMGAAYSSAQVSSANTLTVSGLAIGGITGANGSLPGDYVLNGGATSLSVAATIMPTTVFSTMQEGLTPYSGTHYAFNNEYRRRSDENESLPVCR